MIDPSSPLDAGACRVKDTPGEEGGPAHHLLGLDEEHSRARLMGTDRRGQACATGPHYHDIEHHAPLLAAFPTRHRPSRAISTL